MSGKDVTDFLIFLKKEFRKNNIWWGFFAGFAVSKYVPKLEREVTDIDIFCDEKDFEKAIQIMSKFPHTGVVRSKGMFDLMSVGFNLSSEVEIVASIRINKDGRTYLFSSDSEMKKRCRMIKVENEDMPFISPEDIIALKLLGGRGRETGKHDIEDALEIMRSVEIDKNYLLERAERSHGYEKIKKSLSELGFMPV
jgi:hypothetical protein